MTGSGKRRLGRGLEALLGPTNAGAGVRESLIQLPVGSVTPNPFQPRRNFDEAALGELMRSIRRSGLMQPILVRPHEHGRYELIVGERRWRAVQRLGWSEITGIVRHVDDRLMLTLALIENLQRDDLSPIDEARGYAQLISEFGHSQQEIAEAVGRDRSTVANALRLLKLPAAVQTMVDEGRLSVGHARALLGLGDPHRITDLAREAARNGLSVRDVEARLRAVRKRRRQSPSSDEPATKPAEVRRVEDALRKRLQTDVAVRVRGTGGKIEFTFYSNDDLARLLELILGEPFR